MKIAIFTYSMNVGGVETFWMNTLDNLDTKKYSIDFICYKNLGENKIEKIKSRNANVFQMVNPDEVNIKIYLKELYQIIKKGKYDVVYANTFTNSAYIMFISYLCGVKKRITHSHTAMSLKTKNIKKLIKWNLSKFLIKVFATKKIACGLKAGNALFGNSKFITIENGIHIEKFKFSMAERKKLQSIYNISKNNIVIGHVGRFTDEKNHIFLIKVFSELVKINENFKLLLIGNGPNFNEIEKLVQKYKIEKNVIFTGMVDNPHIYYNLMDKFVLPSLYEGFPLTIIEAQTNGLPCYCSKNVSPEVDLSNKTKFIELDEKIWVNELKQKEERYDKFNEIKKSNYNIDLTIQKIIKLIEE